ncbi:hypothetical protein, partial [Aphanothece sacrum]|uniref:hypothetical protein n=1 Tax=Aphanothece sacrum TaxID=1122 RepID=UPI001D13252B
MNKLFWPILKNANDLDKKSLFLDIIEGFKLYNVSVKIDRLKVLLIKFMKDKKIFNSQTYPLKISVST